MDREEARCYLDRYNKSHGTSLVLGDSVGKGGMGEVFDLPGTNPPQVVKIMKTTVYDSADLDMWVVHSNRKRFYEYFTKEISCMRELRGNPYSMPLLDYQIFHDPEDDFLQLPDGRTWKACFLLFMPRLKPLRMYLNNSSATEDVLIRLAKDICRCLEHMEKKKILHRDVKPMNIFADDSDDMVRFVLGDFGICRRQDLTVQSGMTMIQPNGYIAPELLNNTRESDYFNADVYSLGAVLYTQISNTFPHDHYLREKSGLPFPDTISKEFARIIDNACQYSFRDRYRGAAQMLEDLENLDQDFDSRTYHRQILDLVKQALAAGNLRLAYDYASYGSDMGHPICRRLLAYCGYNLMRKERRGHADHTDVLRQEDSGCEQEALTEELEDLIFSDEDRVAQCLRGLIYLDEGDPEQFYRYVRYSADAGCAMAQYYYGRALCEGWCRTRDRKTGCRYILLAAEAGYLPAVVFLRDRLYPLEPEISMSASLERQLLCLHYSDEEIRSSIITFLLD